MPYRPLSLKHSRMAAQRFSDIRGHVQHSPARPQRAAPNVQPLPPHAVEGPQTTPIANMAKNVAKNVATTKGTDHKWPVRSAREVLGGPSPRRQSVESDHLKSVGFRDGVLTVRFHSPDKVYVFYDVPPSVHQGLMRASSKSKYFLANIKGKFVTRHHSL